MHNFNNFFPLFLVLGADWRDLPNIAVTLKSGRKSNKLRYPYVDMKTGKPCVCSCATKRKVRILSNSFLIRPSMQTSFQVTGTKLSFIQSFRKSYDFSRSCEMIPKSLQLASFFNHL